MPPEEVIAKVFGVPLIDVTDDTSNTTVSTWDSLAHITLILELEATYRVSLLPEEVFNMTSVASIKKVLGSRGINW
ncbi:MAG: acyl carrier protein [Gammaproteobacteria bacterium]